MTKEKTNPKYLSQDSSRGDQWVFRYKGKKEYTGTTDEAEAIAFRDERLAYHNANKSLAAGRKAIATLKTTGELAKMIRRDILNSGSISPDDLEETFDKSEFADKIRAKANGTKALKAKIRYIRRFVEWLKQEHPEVITLAQVDQAIAQRYAYHLHGIKGVALNTRYYPLTNIRVVFDALKSKIYPAGDGINPFANVALSDVESVQNSDPDAKHLPLQDDWTEQLLVLLRNFEPERQYKYEPPEKDDFYLIGMVAVFTGQRFETCVRIETSKFSLDTKQGGTLIPDLVQVTATKTGKDHTIPVHPELRAALEPRIRRAQKNGDKYLFPKSVFHYESGNKDTFLRWFNDRFDEIVVDEKTGAKLQTQISLPGRKRKSRVYSMHSLRHSAIAKLRAVNTPDYLIEEITGHKCDSLKGHYANTNSTLFASKLDTVKVSQLALKIKQATSLEKAKAYAQKILDSLT